MVNFMTFAKPGWRQSLSNARIPSCTQAEKAPFSSFGMAAYVICRPTEEEAQAKLARITDVKESSGYAGYQDFVNKSQLEQQIQLRDPTEGCAPI